MSWRDRHTAAREALQQGRSPWSMAETGSRNVDQDMRRGWATLRIGYWAVYHVVHSAVDRAVHARRRSE